jgi:hypothetical protein
VIDYNGENWLACYQAALVELEQAKMSGRIKEARTAIVARVEQLQTMPGLHGDERQAIADALSSLRYLEQEEERHDAAIHRRAVEAALRKFRSSDPALLKNQDDQTSD